MFTDLPNRADFIVAELAQTDLFHLACLSTNQPPDPPDLDLNSADGLASHHSYKISKIKSSCGG